MQRIVPFMALFAALLLGAVPPAVAEPTEVTVRVISRDAKFIGTSMGGVRITLRDAETGEPLATGITRGGTGDTAKIMHEDRGRRARLADETAAAFTTELDLERPRRVEVEAYGPLGQPQAAHRVTSTQWVVPGRHLSGGDGWVLEMPGFVVDVLEPPAHRRLDGDTEAVGVQANVVMMCGCPIEPGGLWDARDYEVAMIVTRNGEYLDERGMEYAGETSLFQGEAPVRGPGAYEVTVFAHDPANGNTGLDRTTFVIQ